MLEVDREWVCICWYVLFRLLMLSHRWHTAGRLWYVRQLSQRTHRLNLRVRDILYELASVGDLALPTPSPQPQKKRERDSDFSAATSRSSPASSDHGPRAIAGSRRVSKDTNLVSGGPSVSGQFFNLPLHSEELGRLPLHGQVNFFTRPEEQQHQGPARSDFSTWYGPSTGVPAEHQAHGSYAVQEPSSFYDQLGHALNGHSLHAAFDAGPSVAGDQPPSVSVNMPPGIDTDTMAMWSNAPAGFE